MDKTLLLRRKLVAFADYCIAFKKLATYEEFSKLVGMMPGNWHISKALCWMAELDLMNNHPIRSSIFVKIPTKDENGNIIKASNPGEGYFKFFFERGLLEKETIDLEFWSNQLRKIGFQDNDLSETYGVKL